ncbi:ABC transporter ATP-binding protein [Furfurilactobacillus siliginis]|uniref:Multidrug resistance ABC transporter ATP-binding and permease protein n=1 Tax=Furfurilactobacillus siliginis TaxID=348151 RepID=A0A0R2L1D7_9LACO|nr:ABC transporter ATP-binding protein [Furfurilactobacillus siliginis]KRN95486.1 multiABC transporter [Furfurilactobacillus siliginis]GEK29436.1 multidrug resistance ABC transporter ATP-binding and permease protein [Furfurilactobacillus siliginis]
MQRRPQASADGKPTAFSMRQFIQLINAAKPRYLLLIGGMLVGLLATALQLVVPTLAKGLVDQFKHGIDYHLLAGVAVIFILAAIFSGISGTVLGIFGESVVQGLRERVWRKLITLRVHYFDVTKSGEMSSRLINDTTQVKDLLANTVPAAFSSLLMVLGSVVMMLRMDWHMTVAMVVVVPLAMVVIIPLITISSRIGHARQDALADFNGTASETLSEIRLVKSSNAEAQTTKQADTAIKSLFSIGLREAVVDAIMSPFLMMVMMLMIFGLLAYGIHRVSQGSMSIGTLMSFLMYLFNLIGAVPTLANLFSATGKAAGSTNRIHDLLEEPEEDLEQGQPVDASGQALGMSHVDFAYDPKEPILHDVTFTAKPNQIVAFAGPSGGGKSTIFSLLERFYDPTSGQVTLGDQNIATFKLSDWRAQIGFVSQDSAIMAGTIRENLTYGLKESVSDDALWHVLELAFAKDFVSNMDHGLDTQVGERGVKVSGGQRQRLAIARAFLRDPKILMLDEATASLDSESEAMVQKALTNMMKGRTTLVIAHRLATIVNADRIYFVEKGHITGAGTHQELVASHDLYREYVAEQFNQ